jgi:hypothetical protein
MENVTLPIEFDTARLRLLWLYRLSRERGCGNAA